MQRVGKRMQESRERNVSNATPMNIWTQKFSNGDRHVLAIGERRSTMTVWHVKSGCPQVIPINAPSCLRFMVHAGIGELRRRGLQAIASAYQMKQAAVICMSRPPATVGTRN